MKSCFTFQKMHRGVYISCHKSTTVEVYGSKVMLLTWASFTGHWVLFNVRCSGIAVVRCFMDPPIRPLAKQNPGRKAQAT